MGAGLLFVGLLAFSSAFVLAGCSGEKADVRDTADSGSKEAAAPADSITFDTSSREPLGPPMPFPSVPVRSIEGDRTDTAALVRGRYSIVIFLKVGCEACAEVLEIWEEVRHEFPREMNVIAVTREEPALARAYVEETGFPFPLYCDEKGVFETQYGIGKYPAMVGVVNDGKVAYVGKPVTPEFTPRKAWKLLVEVAQARMGQGAEPDPGRDKQEENP